MTNAELVALTRAVMRAAELVHEMQDGERGTGEGKIGEISFWQDPTPDGTFSSDLCRVALHAVAPQLRSTPAWPLLVDAVRLRAKTAFALSGVSRRQVAGKRQKKPQHAMKDAAWLERLRLAARTLGCTDNGSVESFSARLRKLGVRFR